MSSIIRQVYKTIRFGGVQYRCIVCGRGIRKFFRFSTELEDEARRNGFPYDFRRVETLNFDQCNCPFCLASDRERLYLIYLEKYFGEHAGETLRLLDFAPPVSFSENLRARKNIGYVSADLFRKDVDINVDICQMDSVADGSFDIIICSHVLEHVDHPQNALSEIRRVLAPRGIAIIMVPLFFDVRETVEDPAHNTRELRLRYYGQDDHLRLYARHDFLHVLGTAGFIVDPVRIDTLDPQRVRQNAIASDSVLYVVRKA
jgi:SAM-dependent methyltransferase